MLHTVTESFLLQQEIKSKHRREIHEQRRTGPSAPLQVQKKLNLIVR